jgi:hypothetical protein
MLSQYEQSIAICHVWTVFLHVFGIRARLAPTRPDASPVRTQRRLHPRCIGRLRARTDPAQAIVSGSRDPSRSSDCIRPHAAHPAPKTQPGCAPRQARALHPRHAMLLPLPRRHPLPRPHPPPCPHPPPRSVSATPLPRPNVPSHLQNPFDRCNICSIL